MNFSEFNKYFGDFDLSICNNNLLLLTGENLKILGEFWIKVAKFENDVEHLLNIIVIESPHFIPLLGRNWMDILYPKWRNYFRGNNDFGVKNIIEFSENENNFIKYVKNSFKELFEKSLEEPMVGFEAEIYVKEGSRPIFNKAYDVPFKLKETLDLELERLVKEKIIVPIKRSEWASPLVIVPKENGKIRVCVDCKVSINKVLSTEHYPLPNINDLLSTSMRGCKIFTKLDLTGAYQQLPASESSQKFLVVNTHKGLYKFLRLPYG